MAQWRTQILERRAMTPDEVIANRKVEQPYWEEEEFPEWVVAKMQVTPDVAEFTGVMPAWRGIATAIRCPALLIGADVVRGAIVGAAQAAEAQALNPNIQAAVISGSGHNIRREQFEAYMAVVRRFLEELEQPAA